MKYLRAATEAEMVSLFLAEEWQSPRFREDIAGALQALSLPDALITAPDLTDPAENRCRARVLAAYRGYGEERDIFTHYPGSVCWQYMTCEAEDLDRIELIHEDYWDALSNGTHRPAVCAETVCAGAVIYDQPNTVFLTGAEYLRTGSRFPPLILLSDGEVHAALEGHCRLTAYGLVPEAFPGTVALVGIVSPQALRDWNS